MIRTTVLKVELTSLELQQPIMKLSRSNGKIRDRDGVRVSANRPDILKLRMSEARALASVLNYLADVAEANGPEA